MRVSNIFKKEGGSTSSALLWSTLAVYVLVISFLGSRHEHWHDEWHVWFMCRYDSLLALIKETAGDGHFIPWQLLNFPFVKLGCGFGCLEVMSCILCAIGAWILLFKAPFSYLCKVLLLISFPMLYSFPILARCYALIPPIIFAIGYLYPKLPRHRYLYCFCVGLLSLTHSYMEGMVGALLLLYCYEQLYMPYKERQPWKANVGPAILTSVMVVIAAMHVLLAAKIAQANDIHRIDSNMELVSRLFDTYAIQPFQALSLTGSMTLPNLDLTITAAVWITVLIALYKCLWRDATGKRLAIVGFASIAYMFIFGTSIYFMTLQRLLLPFFVIVSLLWCYYRPSLSKYISLAIIGLVVMTSFNHYKEVRDDISRSYCNAIDAAAFVRENITTDEVIAQGAHYSFIYELLYKDYASYELGTKEEVLTDDVLDAFVAEHSCQTFYPISMISHSYQGEKYDFKCLYDENAADAMYYGFYVYKVELKPDEQSTSERLVD